jgi:hypothetical protein
MTKLQRREAEVKLLHSDVLKGLKAAHAEREAERAELQEHYKVEDGDSPEVRQQKQRALEAAMLDP